MKRLIAIGVAALALSACSQVSALTPVGGTAITSVRNATYEVLVDQKVSILEAPQCIPSDSGFTCTGSTIDGAEIVATAQGTNPYPMTITVGGVVIFEGNAQDVLDAAVLEAS